MNFFAEAYEAIYAPTPVAPTATDNGLKQPNDNEYPMTRPTASVAKPQPVRRVLAGDQEFDLDSSILVSKYGSRTFAVWLVGGKGKPEGHKELLSVVVYRKGAEAIRKFVMELQNDKRNLEGQLQDCSRQQQIA